MFKCANGHEMLKAQKFCGECGGAAAAPPADDHVECGSCSGAMMKSAKFCPECGTPAGPLGADLDSVLTEVDTFVKSLAAVESDLGVGLVPEVDTDEAVDEAAVERILKSAAVIDPETREQLGIDSVPVVTEFLKGQAVQVAQARDYHGHTSELFKHTFATQATILKSVAAIGRAVQGLQERVEKIAGAPRGQHVVAAVRPAARANTDADIKPGDLIVKATVAASRDGNALTANELSALETWTAGGAGLHALRDLDPALASRVERAINGSQQ